MRAILKALLFMCLIYCIPSQAEDMRKDIPARAYELMPFVKAEVLRLIPGFPQPYYFMALVEHETCPSLVSKSCLNPHAKLLSKREKGIGISQITITYNEDGSVRYDGLGQMRKAYMAELKDLSWDNVESRTDLQIDYMVLLVRENYNALYNIKDAKERVTFSDPAYNGGIRDVHKARRICGLTKGCDSQKWFDNVERFCVKSTKPIYGKRSACDINKYHVRNVIIDRMPKYEKAWK